MTEPRVKDLLKWREQIQDGLQAERSQLAQIQKSIKEAEQRLELVEGLLAIEGHSPSTTAKDSQKATDLLDVCERLMREKGTALHVSELHSVLLEQGVPLPGKGTEANLITRLQRSNGRFVRTGRGTYAPASLGLPEVQPTRVRRRARKVKS